MQRMLQGVVDAIESEKDRLGIQFFGIPGFWWVAIEKNELVATLRQSIHRGQKVEVTFVVESNEITDVLPR
jgi:hypothetical protein